ncbi:hypothetical protein [Lewinella sp. IMCC34183]|uniref:hypothetical protein n=1 Tax=Lewinella sp. IMCC34183 TaxID=2248762 RepID=UPI000E2868B5|nr:hypothetical protein [Lewinella sp. IMCC34183]
MPLLLLLLLLTAGVSAQIDTTRAPFVAYWSAGDTYHFEVSKIKSTYVNEELTKSDTNTYRSTFEVMDSTAHNYLIKYTFGQSIQTPGPLDPAIASALDSFALDYILYTTDQNGAFEKLVNWEAFSAAMRQAFAAAERSVIGKGEVDTTLFRTLLAPVVEAYSSEAGIYNKVVNELQHFHTFYGASYGRGDTLRYEDSFGNMFGGDPFPVESELYVEELNWSDDFVVLRHFNRMTPEGAEVFRATLRQAYPDVAGEDGSAFDGMSLDIFDDNWYAFYYYPGIPYKIENDRWTTLTAADKVTVTHERLLVEWVD